MARGRWASSKSARRYIQAGRAILLTTGVPSGLASFARVIVQDLLLSFSLAQSHGVGAGS